ncbi:MAG: hypothetical protein WD579_00995 [Candidatus Paceibacterota bacterium]
MTPKKKKEISNKDLMNSIGELATGQSALKDFMETMAESQMEIKRDISGLKTGVGGLKKDISGLKGGLEEIKNTIATKDDVRELLSDLKKLIDELKKLSRKKVKG